MKKIFTLLTITLITTAAQAENICRQSALQALKGATGAAKAGFVINVEPDVNNGDSITERYLIAQKEGQFQVHMFLAENTCSLSLIENLNFPGEE